VVLGPFLDMLARVEAQDVALGGQQVADATCLWYPCGDTGCGSCDQQVAAMPPASGSPVVVQDMALGG
jgi:hypothetical protein